MDIVIELAKGLAALAGVVITLFKFYAGGDGEKDRRLAERYERTREFLSVYNAGGHPMAVEAAFAAATGRTGVSAPEIAILMRQAKPTHFATFYSQTQDYLRPDTSGERLELQSIAARPRLRTFLARGGLVLYFVLASMAAYFGLFVLPDAIGAHEWKRAWLAAFNMSIFVSAGIYILRASSRLYWAVTLYEGQSRRSDPLEGNDALDTSSSGTSASPVAGRGPTRRAIS